MLSWEWLGEVDHADAVDRMERARAEVIEGRPEVLLLCTHPAVITLGRSASRDDVLDAGDIPIVEASRGGLVTYHDLGQLMVYPIVALRDGVVGTLSAIAGALAEVAATCGAPGAAWRREPAGLWVGPRKLAACGVHIRRRVLIHGFAFNVSTAPDAWDAIVPCGLAGQPHISLRELSSSEHEVAEVAQLTGPAVARALGQPDRAVT